MSLIVLLMGGVITGDMLPPHRDTQLNKQIPSMPLAALTDRVATGKQRQMEKMMMNITNPQEEEGLRSNAVMSWMWRRART